MKPGTHLFVFALILFALSQFSFAQDNSDLSVDKMVICTSVEDREPAGVDTAFSAVVGQVFCYSVITGAQDSVTVSHVWYHNDVERARVDLNIKAARWRTWTSKNITVDWVGSWRVDVVDSSGNVLASTAFEVSASSE